MSLQTTQTTHVLLIEDNPEDARIIRDILSRDALVSFQIDVAEQLDQGIEKLLTRPYNILLVDLDLSGNQGLDVFHQVCQNAPGIPVIVLTSIQDEAAGVQAVHTGAQDYLVKSQQALEILPRSIRYAIERERTHASLQASERRFRALIEYSSDAIGLMDVNGIITYSSPSISQIIGYPPEEIIGTRVFNYTQEGDLAENLALLHHVLENPRKPVVFQSHYRHKSGERQWVEITATNLLDEPSVAAIILNLRDVTERKQAEEALRQSQAQLSNALTTAGLGYWEYDPALDQFNFDSHSCDILHTGAEFDDGYSIPLTRYLQQFVCPDDHEVVLREIDEALEGSANTSREFEYRICHSSGETRHIFVRHLKIESRSGGQAKLVGAIQDITKYKRAEAVLRFKLRLSEMAFSCDTTELITTALDEAEALTGSRFGFFHLLDAEQKKASMHVWSTNTKKILPAFPEQVNEIEMGGGFAECIQTQAPVIHNGADYHHRMPPGHPFITRDLLVPVTQNGVFTAIMGIANKEANYTTDDATILQELALIVANHVARKLAEESLRQSEMQLRQSEDRLTTALTASWMGVWELNWETDTFFWSPECLNIFGIETFDGTLKTLLTYLHPDEIEGIVTGIFTSLTQHLPFATELRIIRPDGEIRWVSVYGRGKYDEGGQAMYMIGTIQDITERKRTQDERHVLMEIMQGSFDAEDLETFVGLIHNAVSKVIKAENFFVILYNKHTGLFEEVYAVDEYDPHMPPDRLENSISAYVFRTGQPILMNQEEFQRLETAGELELVGAQMHSWLGVPLKVYGETIGVLAVQDYHNPDSYSERDRDFLASTAGQIGLAVERKRAEAEIRHLNRQMELILNSAGDGVFGTDTEGLITFINPAMAKMVGYTVQELVGKNMHDTFHFAHENGQAYQHEDCSIMLALQNGIAISSDTDVFWRKDGSCFPVEYTSTPIYEGDQITGTVVVIKDITERKHAEEEAQRRAARTEAFDHFSQLLATQGASESNIIETLAREIVNLLGDECAIQMVSDDDETLLPPKIFFQGENPPDFLQELISIAPTHFQQVTKGNIFQTFEPMIFSTLSPDQLQAMMLPGFAEWLETHRIYDIALLPLNAQGKSIGMVMMIHRHSGSLYSREEIEFLQGLTDRSALAIVNARLVEQVQRHNLDLEHRVAERTSELSRANSELERAARAKDEFLASMSHELRTPLNAILTLTESLEEGIYGELRDSQVKPLRTVSESGHHLLNLINDILDLSKIEAGKLVLQIGVVEVEPICQSSLRLIKQQAQKKHLRMTFHADEKVEHIQADARCLKQMLVNLLSNAVKFTPDGGEIGLEVFGDLEQGTISFTVWDTGIGIDVEDAHHLFQPFVQANSSLSRQYGGTGLGLSLVYRMAEMHRGSVSMSSIRGQGSRFTITLPWVQAAGEDHFASSDVYTLPNLRKAVVIEDSPTAADHIEQFLNEVGVQVFILAANENAPKKAVEISPDIMLLNIALSDSPGWHVLHQIKNDPQIKDIPVIITSAFDEVERSIAQGASDYLAKPVDRAKLYKALRKTIPNLSDTGDNIYMQETPRRPVVLIAEDNPANQTTFSDYLSAKGCQVALASNGLEAIERAHEMTPDLILMDIQMPGLDGLETIRRIRADDSLRGVPIIALTALAMPGDRERCLSSGADEYLTKPVSLKKLVLTVSQYISRNTA